MKDLIKICISATFLLLISGCTPATFQKIQTPKPLKHEIIVITPKDKENKTVWIRNEESTLHNSLQVKYQKMAETFYATAIHGKNLGYSYFAITAENMNNLSGFPINSFDNVIAFCDFERITAKKYYKPRPICWSHSGGLFDLYDIRLQVQYFKDPIPGLFLYNIDEVITQTEKYL
jgi:hypothetical protein